MILYAVRENFVWILHSLPTRNNSARGRFKNNIRSKLGRRPICTCCGYVEAATLNVVYSVHTGGDGLKYYKHTY